MIDYIKIEDCIPGGLYRLRSRNLAYGVCVHEGKGFVGIRRKFDVEYLDTEYHYDIGPPSGTAFPIDFIAQCPLRDLGETYRVTDEYGKPDVKPNQPLFDWIAVTVAGCRHAARETT